MRLINTRTFELKEFSNPKTRPRYAILSHRWLEDEISFQHMQNLAQYRHLDGYSKLAWFCYKAREYGYEWGWQDTCCINDANLMEKSEAINSMFAWYRESDVCFVYLHDLTAPGLKDISGIRLEEALMPCDWFKRGWTLQELIAPRKVWFFDYSWNKFGTRHDMDRELHKVTHISTALLNNRSKLEHFSIAQKMSWAAFRQTTKVEDRAYSLLGLFGINMSLLYGEGDNAFFRLQEELIKQSSDQSILAWTLPYEDTAVLSGRSMVKGMPFQILAPSPDCFHRSTTVPFAIRKNYDTRTPPRPLLTSFEEPFRVTNRGLEIKLLGQKVGELSMGHGDGGVTVREVYRVLLNCFNSNAADDHALVIYLVRSSYERNSQYHRSNPYLLREYNVAKVRKHSGWSPMWFLIEPLWRAPTSELPGKPSRRFIMALRNRARDCDDTMGRMMKQERPLNAIQEQRRQARRFPRPIPVELDSSSESNSVEHDDGSWSETDSDEHDDDPIYLVSDGEEGYDRRY